jgi:hypothetical protein
MGYTSWAGHSMNLPPREFRAIHISILALRSVGRLVNRVALELMWYPRGFLYSYFSPTLTSCQTLFNACNALDQFLTMWADQCECAKKSFCPKIGQLASRPVAVVKSWWSQEEDAFLHNISWKTQFCQEKVLSDSANHAIWWHPTPLFIQFLLQQQQ